MLTFADIETLAFDSLSTPVHLERILKDAFNNVILVVPHDRIMLYLFSNSTWPAEFCDFAVSCRRSLDSSPSVRNEIS